VVQNEKDKFGNKKINWEMIKMSKPNVFLKSTIRQPIFTIFLLLILELISFAFIAKAVEYFIIQREVERLGGYYRSIGELNKFKDVEGADFPQAIAMIQDNPELAFLDARRYSSGVMEGIYNADIDGSSNDSIVDVPFQFNDGVFNMDVFFYGTLTEVKPNIITDEQGKEKTAGYMFKFLVDSLVEGYPEQIETGEYYGYYFSLIRTPDAESILPALMKMQVGQRYLLRGRVDRYMQQFSGISVVNRENLFYFTPLDGQTLWYIQVGDGEEVDLNNPQYAAVLNEIGMLHTNLHALLLVGTADMSAIPRMQQSRQDVYLMEGRWLNREDDLSGRRAIVIASDLATTRGLKLGDQLTITMRGLKEPYYGYIRTGIDNRDWQNYPVNQETVEIVGIYSSRRQDRSIVHYPSGTIAYVPNSIIPDEVAYPPEILIADMELNDYSFVLGNPRDQDAFLNQYQAPLADLGFSISFVTNNGKNFWAGADPVKKATTTGLLLYSAALLLSMALLVFLFLRQQRRNFAIIRALGVPEKESTRQLLFPLAVIGALGTIAGGLSSWNYSLEKAADSLSRLPTPAGVMPSATLHPVWLAGLCLGVFALFLGFSWVGLRILTHKPVLAQLQEGAAPVREKTTISLPPEGTVETDIEILVLPQLEPLVLSGKVDDHTLLQHTQRHLLRSAFKSSLTLAVALGFVLTLGWLRWNLERNQAEVERLYLSTLLQADLLIKTPESFEATNTEQLRISRIFSRGLVDKLMETGLVKKVYLETLTYVTHIKDEETGQFRKVLAHSFIGCNDLRIAHLDYLEGAVFQFLPGYDEEIFTKEWTKEDLETALPPIILPEDILEADDLELGGSVTWMDRDGQTATYLIAATYTGGSFLYSETDPSSGDGSSLDSDTFTPMVIPLSILDIVSKSPLNYDVVKLYIDPVYNRNLEEV
jgi:hypothetical protein